ncbi:hypothetical protein D3C72_682240 [compost metagenome]
MTRAEIVDGDLHAQFAKLLEQLQGDRRWLDKFAFGQFQYQVDRARLERIEKLAAILDQIQVLAMAGGNVDANVKGFVESGGFRREQGGGLSHERTGHRYDQPAVLGKRDEQVRTHQAFLRMFPAHQHFSAGPAFAVAMHHGLEIRNELCGFQCPLHFLGGGRGALLQEVTN